MKFSNIVHYKQIEMDGEQNPCSSDSEERSSPTRISREEDEHYFGNEDFDDRDLQFAKHSHTEDEDTTSKGVVAWKQQRSDRQRYNEARSVLGLSSRRGIEEKRYSVSTLCHSETAVWKIPITLSAVTTWENEGSGT